jgi:hypothetical protein
MAKKAKASKSSPQKNFLAAVKGMADSFDNSRKGVKGFELIEVDAGRYTVRLKSIELSTVDFTNQKNIPKFRLNGVVVESQDADDLGMACSFEQLINNVKFENGGEITEDECWERIHTALQAFGVDTSELELSELPDLAEELGEDNPACKVTVKLSKKGNKYIAWGKLVDDEDLPGIDDVLDDDDSDEELDDDSDDVEELDDDDEDEDEDSDDSDDDDELEDDDESDDDDDDDSDESDEDEEDEDDEDEEDYVPTKGDSVKAKPKGARKVEKYTIKTVNKRREVCTLIRERDKAEFKDQAWSVISQ